MLNSSANDSEFRRGKSFSSNIVNSLATIDIIFTVFALID